MEFPDLIKKYKEKTASDKNQQELYKWIAVKHFQENWNTDAPDFGNMFINSISKQANLLSIYSSWYIKMLAKHLPEDLREMFRDLYDETADLRQRLERFITKSAELLPKVREIETKPKLNHQQDERALSVYLTLKYPEKYYFYKASYYKKLCKRYNEPVAKVGEKYHHFIRLADEFKEKYIDTDDELIQQNRGCLTSACFQGDDRKLLVQNILYETLENGGNEINKLVNPFNLNSEQLSILIDSFKAWSERDEAEKTYPESKRKVAEELRKTLLNPDYIENTTDDQLLESVLRYSKQVEGKMLAMKLTEAKLRTDLEEIRRNLYYIAGKDDEPFTTAEQILEGDYKIKEYSTSFWTPIFSAQYPELLPNWNNKTDDFHKKLGVNLKSGKLILSEQYKLLSRCFLYLKHIDNTQDFYTLNHLMHYGTAVAEGSELIKKLLQADQNSTFIREQNIKQNSSQKNLNQILYGPPGTGKTYHSVNEAVKIADPEYFIEHSKNREMIRERFNQLLINDWENPGIGRIGFCTFHQSFTYEDFIEGIKPVKPKDQDTYLKYDIEDGIFKLMADRARYFASEDSSGEKPRFHLSESEYQTAQFYKLSLGDVNVAEDQAIYDYCIENDCIAIGFMIGVNLEGKSEKQLYEIAERKNLGNFSVQAMTSFIHSLKVGNYVVISKGLRKVRAIGRVTGEYYYLKDSPIEYNSFRKVEWLHKNVEIPVDEVYEKIFSQQTIYKLKHEWMKKSFFLLQAGDKSRQGKPNFVLIIDEINRGNISQIFGELITLIESDKRAGAPEALELTLPYSKSKFSVPANLYIIGTMNTADRSIEALDTALRRRFTFREMHPEPAIIEEIGPSKGFIGEIDLVKMLSTINSRIEKLIDRDHQIGHSYFLEISALDGLKCVFRDKIIPLLEEYFYGDFGKIGLVLGNAFVRTQDTKEFSFAHFDGFDPDVKDDLSSRKTYEISDPDDWDESAFIRIYSV